MIVSESLLADLRRRELGDWADQLPGQIDARMDPGRYGDLPKWQAALDRLPQLIPQESALDTSFVTVGSGNELDEAQRQALRDVLMDMHPWRKGPFRLFGLGIDTEWRSNMKWERIRHHITPLDDRFVLDVGSGNGYYALRMAGDGAARVVGIDPTPLFVMQYQVFRRYLPEVPVDILPLALEDMPEHTRAFDTVVSMGVLYHRRSPLDHILRLRDCLRPGGELVLETLVIEGDSQACLVPEGRYAKMRNTWFIPSTGLLETWLKRCGFRDVRVADVSATGPDEQRRTDWMHFESLADFLDPGDSSLTVEGHPAPRRATLIARCP